MIARIARALIGSCVFAALPFLGAWKLDWDRAWIFAAVFVVVSVAGSIIAQVANPEVMAARDKGLRTDTKPFDRLFYRMFLPLMVTTPILAGIDAGHFAWGPLPFWTLYPGALLFMAGSIVTTWTLVVNTHAETTVRIQEDRGHAVVTTGPYSVVRHPMYAGVLLGMPGTALMLGSGWALIPMALTICLFVWRTAREDTALRQELPGYEDYTRITPYRLVPGLW